MALKKEFYCQIERCKAPLLTYERILQLKTNLQLVKGETLLKTVF